MCAMSVLYPLVKNHRSGTCHFSEQMCTEMCEISQNQRYDDANLLLLIQFIILKMHWHEFYLKFSNPTLIITQLICVVILSSLSFVHSTPPKSIPNRDVVSDKVVRNKSELS